MRMLLCEVVDKDLFDFGAHTSGSGPNLVSSANEKHLQADRTQGIYTASTKGSRAHHTDAYESLKTVGFGSRNNKAPCSRISS